MASALRLENVTRRYKEGAGELEVFSGLNLELQPGEALQATSLRGLLDGSDTADRLALGRLWRRSLRRSGSERRHGPDRPRDDVTGRHLLDLSHRAVEHVGLRRLR